MSIQQPLQSPLPLTLQQQAQKQWLNWYQTPDLAKALVRQYLIQCKFNQTLKIFEEQSQKYNQSNHLSQSPHAKINHNGSNKELKKINKSVLIKMLSLVSLYQQNKVALKPWKTLLQVLVDYLRNKFNDKLDKNIQSNTNKNTQNNPRKYSIQPSQKNKTSTSKAVSQLNQSKQDKIQNNRNLQDHNNNLSNQKNKFSKTGFQYKPKSSTNQYPQQLQNNTRKVQSSLDHINNNQINCNTSINSMGCGNVNDASVTSIPINAQINKVQQSKTNDQYKQLTKVINKQIKINSESVVQKQKIQQQQLKPQNEASQFNSRTGGMRKWKKGGQPKDKTNVLAESQQKQKINELTETNVKNSNQNKNIQVQKSQNMVQIGKKKQFQTENNAINVNKQDQGKMVKMFGKKKAQNNDIKNQEPKKFKFDENFVDAPLNVTQKYNYQKIDMSKIIILQKQQSQIKYNQKPITGNQYQNTTFKKKNERLITQSQAKQLKKIIFQNNSHILPKSWHQGFILSSFQSTPYGLKQIEGGPCGIIAAVQCYFLKHLLYLSQPNSQKDISNETRRQICLVAAITDILMKVKSQNKLYLVVPPRNFSGVKLDMANMSLVVLQAENFKQGYEGVWQYKNSFIGQSNHGVTSLMYSIVMTKKPQHIINQIDCKQNPLIGHHGHCTQELVNLFITGKAVSNVFDGQKILQDDYRLKGIAQKADFGFLTIFQTLKYIQVGKNLKRPKYPFWVICKQFHYHVIFSNHYLISENDGLGNSDNQKFDIVYFDGLYNCGDKIIITLQKYPFGQEPQIKMKQLPLIQQVMMTKWGIRKADWNGSIKIL